jgi:large subunit ribosomal protein L25
MAIVPLTGSLRERSGKGPARQARRAGRIPGIVYGHGQAALSVAVETREFINALRHVEGNMIVSLKLDGGEKTAIVREVQRDPLTHEILHLDFQEVSLTERVRVEVSVHLIGVPTGVKDGGGILETIIRGIEVECLATAIPASIDVDVSALGIGDSVHVRDIQVVGAEVLTDLDQTIATVVPPTVYEAPAAAEAVAAPTAEEPEVIGKGKEEEGAEPEEKDKEKKEKEKK